ncbi:MAG: hypothetical protein ACSLEN_13140 [Candidatus Malihini olakiniferum]
MTPETLAQITELLGVNDPVGITCELFFRWVIKDNFVNRRPRMGKGVGGVGTEHAAGRDETAHVEW